MPEIAHSRRATDSREYRLEELGKKLLTWGAIIGAISTCAIFYTRIIDLVEAAPMTERRLNHIEKWAAVQDDRWERIEKFMERMDRRLRNN